MKSVDAIFIIDLFCSPSVLLQLQLNMNARTPLLEWGRVGWAYDMRDDEGEAEPEPRALLEAPAARPGDQDEGLADDAHLKVEGRHHRVLVAP